MSKFTYQGEPVDVGYAYLDDFCKMMRKKMGTKNPRKGAVVSLEQGGRSIHPNEAQPGHIGGVIKAVRLSGSIGFWWIWPTNPYQERDELSNMIAGRHPTENGPAPARDEVWDMDDDYNFAMGYDD